MSTDPIVAVGNARSAPQRPLAASHLRRLWWGLRIAQVRLRFLFVLVVAFLIVGKWNVLRNYWDTFTFSPLGNSLGGGVSSDTEYFCPMCPGVLSEWPSKCSVCNMPLVRRYKGQAVQLPDGVLARMQLSPYRVQLAGLRTEAVEYRPLLREFVASGIVVDPAETPLTGDSGETSHHGEIPVAIEARILEHDIPFVAVGGAALVETDAYSGRPPLTATVLRVDPRVSPKTRRVNVTLAADDDTALWPGMGVTVRFQRPIAELEPFRSQPSAIPELKANDVRQVFACPDHPLVVREKPGNCPEDDNPLVLRPLGELERVVWWCPMHPKVTAVEGGHECEECNGMRLLPRVIRYRPPGQVLAVPEAAVIDTGRRRVVYLERMPGMFDGVEIEVGPLCDGYYSVIRGLEPGQRVAATGAFLVDAETRLNPNIAASYFGAGRGKDSNADPPQQTIGAANASAIDQAIDKLSPAEKLSARRQKLCPITGLALGSMGTPVKVQLKGHTVWLCCAGCQVEAEEDAIKTLEKLKQLERTP